MYQGYVAGLKTGNIGPAAFRQKIDLKTSWCLLGKFQPIPRKKYVAVRNPPWCWEA